MGNVFDPTPVVTVLDRAEDAFEAVAYGRLSFEERINLDED